MTRRLAAGPLSRARFRALSHAPCHVPCHTPSRTPSHAPSPACTLARGLALLLAVPLPAAAQDPGAAAAATPVVVTAARSPQRVDRSLAEVTVIDRAGIDAAGVRTLAELLAGQAGVQSWSHGGAGMTASVSLRGLESRHAVLLVDGMRLGSATVGTPSWDNLPLDAIERIEIVRGPMSGLYGADAAGGVVQVFTRRGQPGLRPEATATLGSHGHRGASAGAGFGSGVVDGSLRLQYRRDDGPSATNERVPFGSHDPDGDGFEQTSLSGRLGLQLGAWRAEATLLSAHGKVQLDDGPGADSRAALRTEVLSAALSGALARGWRSSLQLARSTDDYETLSSASPFASLGVIGTVQRQASWTHSIDSALGTVLLLAERLQQQVERPGAPFEVSRRSVTGLALGLNGESGPHGWQANLRRDRNSQFGRPTTGSLAYGLQLAPGLRAAASFGTSFVAPSFNQLYFPNFGNPTLQPEEGRHREFSLAWRAGTVGGRLAWFDNRIRGYISSGPLPGNIPRVEVQGASASVDARLGAWTLAASLDNQQPLNASAGAANFGRQLPRRVKDSARLSADWQQGSLLLGARWQAQGERFDDAANAMRLGGFAVLDLRADWAWARDWSLGARLNNAFDKRYETVLGYNQPSRALQISLRHAPR